MTAEDERAAIVAWLRQLSDGQLGWRYRLRYAWMALRHPNAIVDAVLWLTAQRIERAEHHHGGE